MFESGTKQYLALAFVAILVTSAIVISVGPGGSTPAANQTPSNATQTDTPTTSPATETTSDRDPGTEPQSTTTADTATTPPPTSMTTTSATTPPTTSTQTSTTAPTTSPPQTTTQPPSTTTAPPTTSTTSDPEDGNNNDNSGDTGEDDSDDGESDDNSDDSDDDSDGDDGSDENDDDGDDGDGSDGPSPVVNPPAGQSSAYYRYLATTQVQSLQFYQSAAWTSQVDASALNETFEYYVALNRTNSSEIFDVDHQLVAQSQNQNLTRLLVASDRLLATQALADAEGLAARYHAQGVDADWRAINRSLSKARQHLETAARQQRRNPNRPGVIRLYQQAWLDAQAAIDALDAAHPPTLELASRADPVANGTYNYTIQGTVSDARTYELDSVVIEIDGDSQRVPIRANATPGATGTFAATVTIDAAPTEIEVRVVDDGTQYASDSTYPNQTTTTTLALDADGLTDEYERTVLGTDPLDADSNATRVAGDQSGNGVLDSREDYDNDTLPTAFEVSNGLDPLDNDTDGDGLPDGFEVSKSPSNATMSDSNDDGVPDGETDFDDDGLVASAEARNGTYATRPDSDWDGLNDSQEIAMGTNPLAFDTDDDGLPDAMEPQAPYETNATDPDTDDDGVLDGNERYTGTTRNETLGVTARVTAEGANASVVTIRRDTRQIIANSPVANISPTPLVSFETYSEFEQATITFQYNDSDVWGAESNLQVYRVNVTARRFVPVNTTVDAANNTVNATTPHFSTYVVMNRREYNGLTSNPIPDKYGINETFRTRNEWVGPAEFEDGIATVGPTPTVEPTNETGWPTYRGEYQRDGSVPGSAPSDLTRILEASPVVADSASIAVHSGDVFVTGYARAHTDRGPQGRTKYLHRVDGQTGELEWVTWIGNTLPRTTPTVHDGRVIVPSGRGVTVVDSLSGDKLWSTQLGCQLDDGQSPVVVDGLVVVQCDRTVVALQLADGQTAWEQSIATERGGSITHLTLGEQRLFVGTDHRVVALSPESGVSHWETTVFDSEIASRYLSEYGPVYDNGSVYVADQYYGSIIQLSASSGRQTDEYLTENWNESAVRAPVVDNGTLYYVKDDWAQYNSEYEQIEPQRFEVEAIDLESHEVVWNRTIDEWPTVNRSGRDVERYPSTLVKRGSKLYVVGDRLQVLDAASGSRVWQSDPWTDRWVPWDFQPAVTERGVYTYANSLRVYAEPRSREGEGDWQGYGNGAGHTFATQSPGPVDFRNDRRIDDNADGGVAIVDETLYTVDIYARGCNFCRSIEETESPQTENPSETDITGSPGGTRTQINATPLESGGREWNTTITGEVVNGPVATDETVFVQTEGNLTALDRHTGDVRWQQSLPQIRGVNTPFETYPLLVSNGTVLVTRNGTMTAYETETGSMRWEREFKSQLTAYPTVSNSTVLVLSVESPMGVNLQTGETVWELKPPSPNSAGTSSTTATQTSLRVTAQGQGAGPTDRPVTVNGTMYATSPDGIYALDVRTGGISQLYSNAGRGSQPPLRLSGQMATHDGKLVLTGYQVSSGVRNSVVVAVDRQTGSVLWRNTDPSGEVSNPIVAGNRVYVSTPTTNYRLDATTGQTERRVTRETSLEGTRKNAPVFAVAVHNGVYFTRQSVELRAVGDHNLSYLPDLGAWPPAPESPDDPARDLRESQRSLRSSTPQDPRVNMRARSTRSMGIEDPSAGSNVRTLRKEFDLRGKRNLNLDTRMRVTLLSPDASVRVVVESENRGEFVLYSRSGSEGTGQTQWMNISAGKYQMQLVENDEVTVSYIVEGDAEVEVSSLRMKANTDEDAYTNNQEVKGFVDWVGERYTSNPLKADTDGDGLADGVEIQLEPDIADRGMDVEVVADPRERDTDGDGLSDEEEYRESRGNLVHYRPTSSGEPYAWDPDGSESFYATSDPRVVDTDGDGLPDAEERELHTDPRKEVTYAITEQYNADVFELVEEMSLQRRIVFVATLNLPCRGAEPCEAPGAAFELAELTDASSDFDFVSPAMDRNTNVRNTRESIAFVALDGTLRTDVWVSNREELATGTDPWDPDTDDDGLTDGQELYYLTTAKPLLDGENSVSDISSVIQTTPETSPVNPDTDGDGYWDGWIGVHGVGRTANVTLYREHLQTGGVSGQEAIPRQQGVHDVQWTPSGQTVSALNASATAADIDGDGTLEHSTVHVGERHWGTNPNSGSEVPDPRIAMEVGFYEKTSYKIWNRSNGRLESNWLEEVKANYALYDIDVRFTSMEVIEQDEMPWIWKGTLPWEQGTPHRANSPLSERETIRTVMKHKSIHSGQTSYLLVADEPDFQYMSSSGVGGWNMRFAGGGVKDLLNSLVRGSGDVVGQAQGMVVYQGQFPSARASRSTAMHEIAHSFQIGEADDSCTRAGRLSGGEIYSGTQADLTPENISGLQWSIMTSGQGRLMQPGSYYAFSIEELFSIENALSGSWPCGGPL